MKMPVSVFACLTQSGAQETAPPGTGQGFDIKSGHGLSKWVLGVCSLILLSTHQP